MIVLALNGGSSTIKAACFKKTACFQPENDALQRTGKWNLSRQGNDPGLSGLAHELPAAPDIIVHRIVHGGDHFASATRLTPEVLDALQTLIPLAPLHQPFNLDLIAAAQQQWPAAQHIGCFDTGFHQTQSDLTRRYALPRAVHDRGIKRYGFHGLSYAYVSAALYKQRPDMRDKKIVIAHLGSGASACAIQHGNSIACSMGFSTLDGLVMGTRCGQLDPGIVLHLLREGMTIDTLEKLLYKESGLLGVSGISADLRELLNHESVEAHDAVALFASRCAEQIAILATTMQGIDVLVFTGGIGEHQAETRAKIVTRLEWMGAQLDTDANQENRYSISSANSQIAICVIPTDEELEMAQQALKIAE